jgi:hypothetical protein
MVQGENVGPDSDGWENGGPGHDIIERSDQVSTAEGETDLLGGFAHRGGQEVRLCGILPATRQGHVTRPRISQSLGTANEQERVGIGREDDGDRGPDERIAPIVDQRPVGGEPIAKAVEPGGQWLWLWQLPPQHPPPAGGPRRLTSGCFPPVAGRAVRDMSRSSLRPLHWGQATRVSPRTSWSNSASQALQR